MTWTSGDRVIVRGAEWRVVQSTAFSDCEALDLAHEHTNTLRTLLLPFDRPRSPSSPRLQVVSQRRWAREMSARIRAMHPYGGLSSCPSTIRLLPFQLEPALAVLRHGVARVLIADGVGLGKTVEAGLIVREVAMRQHLSRTLIVSPAAVREQWANELAALFHLSPVAVDGHWLRRLSRTLPADVNPWSCPGVYLCSLDFIKRPEVLHPLEDVRWDLVVVDEAHAATPGSDRRAAVDAVASRSRVLLLLTATPHSGDDEQFVALCGIGAEADSPPIVFFNRTYADTPIEKPIPRSCLLRVRLSDAERRTHRLLEDYTARVCAESHGRADQNGKLVATVLRKRALSSLISLALSIRRRLQLLEGPPANAIQLALPLDDEQIGEDRLDDSWLGVAALGDRADERRMLASIVEACEETGGHDSKLRLLVRLLRRVRQPAIVFTEYRDTADYLARASEGAGRRVCVLHGGLTRAERSAVVDAFKSGEFVLVATDAASEGLNLHHRCRLVVHFELPWTPLRLHQRRGRVDRIGQARRVHEVALVARDTCEQLVLAPLVRRARRSQAFVNTSLEAGLSEARVAAHVLGGIPAESLDSPLTRIPVQLRTLDLRAEALQEATRLSLLRRLKPTHPSSPPQRKGRPIVPIARPEGQERRRREAVTLVVSVSLRDRRLARVDQQPLVITVAVEPFETRYGHAVLRQHMQRLLPDLLRALDPVVQRAIDSRISAVTEHLAAACRARRIRDAQLRRQVQSTAQQIVQAGLFDRRALRAALARARGTAIVQEDLDARATATNEPGDLLTGACEVVGVRFGGLS